MHMTTESSSCHQPRARYADDNLITQSADDERQIQLWPDKNAMLKAGITKLITESRPLNAVEKIIFIDFNIYNLDLFLDSDWPSKFDGFKIVLVCDRRMTALANFWFYHPIYAQKISAVIFSTDDLETVDDKIFSILAGRLVSPSREMSRLSFTEFVILQLYQKGMKAKEIAYQFNYGVKTVYTYKNRIEKKLNIRFPKTG